MMIAWTSQENSKLIAGCGRLPLRAFLCQSGFHGCLGSSTPATHLAHWSDMLKGDFDAEVVLNGVMLPLIVVVFAIPFGWILQAVLVVIWNTLTTRYRNPPNSN